MCIDKIIFIEKYPPPPRRWWVMSHGIYTHVWEEKSCWQCPKRLRWYAYSVFTRAATLKFHFPLPRMLISTYVSPTPIGQVFTHKVNGKGCARACVRASLHCMLHGILRFKSGGHTRVLMLIWLISSIFTHHCSFRAL